MLLTTAISLFFGLWSSVFLIDYYLKSFDIKCYVHFTQRIGLTVSFLQLRFYTYRFDEGMLTERVSMRMLSMIAFLKTSRLFSVWFITGAATALLCFCGITVYLSKLLFDEFYTWFISVRIPNLEPISTVIDPNKATPSVATAAFAQPVHNNVALTPVIPGMNMPWWHLPLFVGVCVLAGVIHELGHAMAAIHSNVPVSGFGIFLFAIYPGAFTEIDSDALKRSTAAQKMRIFGAGIWHNLVLALFGYLLFVSMPLLLSPLYSRNDGVLVTEVSKKSGLSGGAGLHRGHIVYAVNGCRVRNIHDWHTCVQQLKNEPLAGYCVPSSNVLPYVTEVKWSANGELHCCGDNSSDISLSHMCFEFRKSESSLSSRPSTHPTVVPNAPRLAESLGLKQSDMHQADWQSAKKGGNEVNKMDITESIYSGRNLEHMPRHACLAARFITDHQVCDVSSRCGRLSETEDRLLCVYPALFNGTSLLRLFTAHSSRPVLFVGHVDELIYFVELSNLVPRFFFIPLWLPFFVELFAKYVVTFSLAMALLNAVPCYGLDGHFISSTIVDSLFSHCTPSRRGRLNSLLLGYGTLILSLNLIIALLRFFVPYFKWSLS